MGISNLPAPSEGVLCIILVNTTLSIYIFKGILRSILHIVGIHLSSSSSSENPEPFDFPLSSPDSYIEEFRNRTPAIRFDALCNCKQLQRDCSVCLTQLEPKSNINRLSCGHLFHKVCLEEMLDYWNVTCPAGLLCYLKTRHHASGEHVEKIPMYRVFVVQYLNHCCHPRFCVVTRKFTLRW